MAKNLIPRRESLISAAWLLVFLAFEVSLVSLAIRRQAVAFSQTDSLVEISEIMYDPVQDDNYNEWVEVRNVSSAPIDFSNWTFCGKKLLAGYVDRAGNVRGDGGLVLEVGGYGLITDGGSGTEVYLNFDVGGESLALHVGASSLCDGSLPNTVDKEKELVLSDGSVIIPVRYQVNWGGSGNGKSLAKDDSGNWKEAEPTPGRVNEFPVENPPVSDLQDQGQDGKQQKPQPMIDFSSPPRVSAGAPFSITVNLSNFTQGAYSIKVLIGNEEKYYDGQTKGIDGRWLTQNIAWKYFPTVTVDSSGAGVTTVQAKVDDDAAAGNYGIKIRIHNDKSNYDSEVSPLDVVIASSVAEDSKPAEGAQSLEEEELTDAITNEGEVLGEEVSYERGFKLNFYIILGILGLLVGSGGLVITLRREGWTPQIGDTPKPETDLP